MSERPYRITVAETGDRDDRTFRTSYADLQGASDQARTIAAEQGKIAAVETDTDIRWFIPAELAEGFPLNSTVFAQVVEPAPKAKAKRAKKT